MLIRVFFSFFLAFSANLPFDRCISDLTKTKVQNTLGEALLTYLVEVLSVCGVLAF